MRITDEVSALLRVQGDDATSPRSELAIAGRPTGTIVTGEVFEAAVALDPDRGGGYLAFLTEGVPFEEGLRIVLLDAAGRLLDQAGVGQAYTPAFFGELEIESPDSLRFRFLGDGHWHLRLLPRPQFRLPLFPEAPCVSRPLGFSRRFLLSTDSARG